MTSDQSHIAASNKVPKTQTSENQSTSTPLSTTHASVLSRVIANPTLQTLTPQVVLALQQTHGNRFVQRLVNSITPTHQAVIQRALTEQQIDNWLRDKALTITSVMSNRKDFPYTRDDLIQRVKKELLAKGSLPGDNREASRFIDEVLLVMWGEKDKENEAKRAKQIEDMKAAQALEREKKRKEGKKQEKSPFSPKVGAFEAKRSKDEYKKLVSGNAQNLQNLSTQAVNQHQEMMGLITPSEKGGYIPTDEGAELLEDIEAKQLKQETLNSGELSFVFSQYHPKKDNPTITFEQNPHGGMFAKSKEKLRSGNVQHASDYSGESMDTGNYILEGYDETAQATDILTGDKEKVKQNIDALTLKKVKANTLLQHQRARRALQILEQARNTSVAIATNLSMRAARMGEKSLGTDIYNNASTFYPMAPVGATTASMKSELGEQMTADDTTMLQGIKDVAMNVYQTYIDIYNSNKALLDSRELRWVEALLRLCDAYMTDKQDNEKEAIIKEAEEAYKYAAAMLLYSPERESPQHAATTNAPSVDERQAQDMGLNTSGTNAWNCVIQ